MLIGCEDIQNSPTIKIFADLSYAPSPNIVTYIAKFRQHFYCSRDPHTHPCLVASVLVSVMDVNDNSPEFSSAEYSGVVTENSGRGAKIIRVGATDRDLNRTITYSLAGGSKEIFQIKFSSLQQ